jgi:hypothetical protein
MEGDMSGFDPTRTRRHVRYPVAIRDKQTWRGQDVENDPVRKFGVHATHESFSAGRRRRNRPSVSGK